MAKFTSLTIPPDADFFELCRLTDKVQGKATAHLLTSDDIKKTMNIFQYVKDFGKKVYVVCLTAYSFKGFRFKSVCTRLMLTNDGGTLSRVEAKEAPAESYGKDSKFCIAVEEPVPFLKTPSGFFLTHSEEKRVFFKSYTKT
jgi:hypothetical protein